MRHIHHYDVPAARSGEIIERLSVVLRDDRFAGSKDWRESGLVGRAEWLIASYEHAKEYYALLEDNAERDEALMHQAMAALEASYVAIAGMAGTDWVPDQTCAAITSLKERLK